MPSKGASIALAEISQATAALMTSAGAFPLSSGSPDCAIVVTVPAGQYSAVLTELNGTAGIGLIEIYEVP